MRAMRVYQALKFKKKLSGEISVISGRLSSANKYEFQTAPEYDAQALLKEYNDKTAELIRLKTALQLATQPIYPKIFEISEKKGLISVLERMDVRVETVPLAYGSQLTKVMSVQINGKTKDDMVKALQDDIETIQDEIDVFNHISEVSW